MIDLFDLAYLGRGSERQRDALRAIESLGLWHDLAEHTPALAGTVPLGVDVEGSDLDVICRADDLSAFAERIRGLYGGREVFRCACCTVRGVESVVAGFRAEGWAFELFAQRAVVADQYACRHLVAEARLLALGGDAAREAVRALKRQGVKTEPAFARHFGIGGDPYEELARLAWATDEELRGAVGRL